MRLATWNLERGGRSKRARALQEEVLEELAADVLVLTEPGPSYESGRAGVVVSSPRTRCEPWVAIVGPSVAPVALEIPYERLAVAATAKVDACAVLVYGSVLPWNGIRVHAPDVVRAGETVDDVFARLVREQVADMTRLVEEHPEHVLVWAGDFNQSLAGPTHGGSEVRRRLLREALEALDLEAWNADTAHACEGGRAIDLLCGRRDLCVTRSGRIDPVRDGVVMSDHAGYWVDILVAPRSPTGAPRGW